MEFSFGGYSSGVWVPVGSLGDFDRPPKAEAVASLQTLFTDFDCKNDQNLKISHNHLLVLDQYVSRITVGNKAKRHAL